MMRRRTTRIWSPTTNECLSSCRVTSSPGEEKMFTTMMKFFYTAMSVAFKRKLFPKNCDYDGGGHLE